MNVTLYSTHCPKCIMLEKKLNMAGVDFTVFDDADEMLNRGFAEIPMLEVDGKLLGFKEAVDWVNSVE